MLHRLGYVITSVSTWLIIAILALSFACIYSSTVYTPAQHLWHKHVRGIIAGLLIYGICACTPAHYLRHIGTYGFYVISVLLCITTIHGTIGMGAQRWLQIAGFTFQPSEALKLVMPFFIVDYLSDRPEIIMASHIRAYWPLLAILIGVTLCVLKQPDLGTAIILCASGIITLWCAGLPTRYIGYCILCTTLAAPIAWSYIKPYQKERILVFLGAGSSHKERYHLEQSRIAIGSGGITGKGWQQGTQNQLRFLPERRTDFIFSVLAEEFGFIGAATAIILYIALFATLLMPMTTVVSITPKLLIIGLALPHMLSVVINIAMVMGLLPVVGIPLPLMSYGLSHLWTTCASFGSINSVTRKWMYR